MDNGNSNTIVIPKSYRGLQVLLVGNDTNSLKYVKSTLEQYSYKDGHKLKNVLAILKRGSFEIGKGSPNGLSNFFTSNVTCEESPAVALSMVGEDQYDLVIADMDLMEMDDFRFFNHVILNTELPMILMSCNEDKDVLRKALNQAACFFLRKPICPQVLASVWQHVFRVRRRQTMYNMDGQGKQILQENDIWEGNNIEIINGESPQVQTKVDATNVQNLSNDTSRSVTNQEKEDCLRKTDEEDDDENDTEDERVNKKLRMSWTDDLRLRFEKAIRILGEEKARPKEILKLMDVSNVTLRHVSSRLQKYREKRKRAVINCATAGPYQSKLTNMDSGMERQYQNGKPWDLHVMYSEKSLVAGTTIQPTKQYVLQQYNTESSSVHYQIGMVKKLLDKAKDKSNYDDIEGYVKGGCYKELNVERSSMHLSNPNEGEANKFRHKETLNPDSRVASQPYVPDIYKDYLASNDCSDIHNNVHMDMGFILSQTNGSGLLEDIIFQAKD